MHLLLNVLAAVKGKVVALIIVSENVLGERKLALSDLFIFISHVYDGNVHDKGSQSHQQKAMFEPEKVFDRPDSTNTPPPAIKL